MAITMTGQDADGYIDEAGADAYAETHFSPDDQAVWKAATTPAQEAAIRAATQYIDATFRDRFPGCIRSTSQALEWPRVNATDRSGRNLNRIPVQVQQATAELAKEQVVSGQPLAPVVDHGGAIKRERVEGVVEVEYQDGAPGQRQYRFAEALLSAVLVNGGNRLVRT